MAVLKMIDANGQITLGDQYAGQTAVSDSSESAVERDDASLLAAALQLRQAKSALFGGA